jgi:hypothetical protein
MTIATVIMSHPDRDALVGELVGAISGPVSVVRDDDRDGVWPNARCAWRRGLDRGEPWVLLLQDDIIPAERLIECCRQIAQLGERCVCLHCFDSKRRREGRVQTSGHWMQIRFSTWGQATLMPRGWVRDFLGWCEHHVPENYPHADTRLTWWLQEQQESCWVPLPNLVKHREGISSVLGHPGGETLHFRRSPGPVDWSSGLDSAPVVRGSPIRSRYEYTDLVR